MELEDIETVTVLGAGTMGHGIAEVAALAGYDVNLRDIKDEFVQDGYDSIEESVEKLESKNQVEDADEVMSRITPLVDLEEAVSDADFIVEAVPEKFEIKEEVWSEVSEHAPSYTVFASNTSSISISRLAEVTDRPSGFVGMHFFNPPVIMELVEVIKGDSTADNVTDLTVELAEDFGKTPVVVHKDSPGFISNRLLMPYINEACWALYEGEATQDEIDATKHELNLPMGPFELADYIGIDVGVDILEYMEDELGEDYSPCPILVEMVEEGKLGAKSGEGFHDHSEEIELPTETDVDAIRTMCVMVNEGAKLVDNDVSNPRDIDTVMGLGMAFETGPMEYSDKVGADRIVEELDRLRDEYGEERYVACDYLRKMAENDETFY